MLFLCTNSAKFCRAEGALVFLFTCVNGLMFHSIAMSSEALVTVPALVRLLTSVCAHVIFKMLLHGKLGMAQVALEFFNAIVYLHVEKEQSPSLESFSAD